MRERIRHIIKKEFRQTFREPRMRMLLFLPPLVQLIIFGFAVNMDVEKVSIGWADRDRTPVSRDLLASFVGSRRFQIVATPVSGGEIERLLDRGTAQGVVCVLPGFGRDVERGETTSVQILIDGTNSNTASIISSYAATVVNSYANAAFAEQSQRRLVARTQAEGGPVHLSLPRLRLESRVWFNPGLESRVYFVPGVIVNIVTLVTLMLTAMAIVREKEIGTMEQLMVSPIQPLELIIGKTVPFAVVGLLDTALVTTAALLIFRVPLLGSIWLLLVCAVLFLLTTLGMGLFISTISHTQQQAMMSSFFFFMPAFMLSGFAFPIRNMPVAVQYLTCLNPVRYFMEIVRNLFLKGSGVQVLWPQMLALLIFGLSILVLSSLRFHKRLD
ncbi:MAG TPA: ABC transporter permease [Terriglobia bacterium]|nr:ABC transporter permease [Terriglobia bacterium]